MSNLRRAFRRNLRRALPPVFSFLFIGAITSACNRSAEKSSGKAEVAPEITPPGWINPRVTFLREHRIDLTGPAGLPDGTPDLVLEVILEPALLKEIGTWEVHGNANLAHWTTAPNNDGWWLIRTELETDQSNGKRARIRLCFPDNNNPAVSTLILRALRPNGAVLFQQTISR